MNNVLIKSAITGAIGTSFMTLLSIITSEQKGRQFREPEILGSLLKPLPLNKNSRLAIGWIAHYITGMGFNMVNQALLKKIKTSPTLFNGLLLGAANGAVGIAIWKAIFEVHPSPPRISQQKYLAHLLLAHIVFAAFSNISMKGMTNKPAYKLSKS